MQLSTLTVVILAAASAVIDAGVLPLEELFLPAVPNNPSSKGTKFLLGFMQNILPRDSALLVPDAYFIVVTDESGEVEFDVTTRFGGTEITRTYVVTYNESKRINYPADDVYVTSATQRDRAIWVQTKMGKRVSVYVINDEAFSTDGYLALPCDGMVAGNNYNRYEYVILSAENVIQQGSRPTASQFLLITCEDDTNVNIRPSTGIADPGIFSTVQFGPDFSSAAANWVVSGSSDIPQKQTLLLAKNSADFTGTLIRTNKPIVVISGHQCGKVPAPVTACDHMATQIPPSTTWGHTFLLNPLSARLSGDLYRFATNLDNTVVTITCVDAGGMDATEDYQMTLSREVGSNWGEFQTHPVPCSANVPFVSKFCCLQSSNPIVLAQYSYGHTADENCGKISGDLGDPFMSVIPPIVQYLRHYHLVPINASAGIYLDTYIGVSVYAGFFKPDGIILDNEPLEPNVNAWQAIYCTEGKICGYSITKVIANEPHVLYHSDENAAIFVHSYGFFIENSYSLSGGMELQPIAGTTVHCVPPEECVEEGNTVTIVCTRDLDTSIASRIVVETSDLSAMAPDDYTAISSLEISFRGGPIRRREIEKTFDVVITDDGIDEPTEDFHINITASNNINVLTPWIIIRICGVGGVMVSFNPTDYTVTEGVDTFANLMLVRTGDLDGETIVTVTTVPGSAIAGSDFESSTITVTFQPGQTQTSVEVPIIDDTNIEDTELFTATLSAGDPSVVIENGTATVNILDTDECPDLDDIPNGSVSLSGNTEGSIAKYICNDGFELVGDPTRVCMSDSTWGGEPPTCQSLAVIVSFDPTDYTVTEGVDGVANLRLIRTGDIIRETVVTVTTIQGSADAGSDYTAVVMTVTFQAGDDTATVEVTILDDTIIEKSEIFTASLSTTESNVMLGDDIATITILDDDVTVSFDPTIYTVTEGVDGVANLRLIRTGDISRETVVTVTTLQGSADAGDFVPTTMTVTFFAGMTEATVQVPIINDNTQELTEEFSAVITTEDPNVSIDEDTAAITILDNDVLNPEFERDMYIVPEDNRTLPLCVDVGVVPSQPTEYIITSKSKNPPDAQEADYSPSTTITVEPPNTVACIDFMNLVVDDDIALEGNQSFTVCVGNSTAMVTIIDDDDPIIESEDIIINEDGGIATIVVNLLNEIENDFVLEYKTGEVLDGADEGDDFTGEQGSIRFVPGGTKSQQIDIPINDDQETENDEPLIVSFSSEDLPPDMPNIPSPQIIIIDNDIIVGFDPTMYTVIEGRDPSVALTVFRTGNIDLPANVTFSTVPGTADVSDFTPTFSTLEFSPGEDEKVVIVPITDDATLEDVEAFSATLISDKPNVIVNDSTSNADITIIDNDRVTIGFVETEYRVEEDDGFAVVTVAVLSGELSDPVVVNFVTQDSTATDPDDYTSTTLSLTFDSETTTQEIDIPITDDNIYELDTETFTADLELVTPDDDVQIMPPKATVFIFDDDLPDPMFENPMYIVPEGDPESVPLCVNISVEITEPITYTIESFHKSPAEAEDSDFNGRTTITIQPPGPVTCIDFTDLINDDDIALEGDEAFGIAIVDSPVMAMVTILDDDEVSVGFDPDDYTVSEGDSTDLTIVRRGDAERPVVVIVTTGGGTATAGDDYVPLDGVEVTFPPGVFTQTITLDTVPDVPVEGNEDLQVLLSTVDARVGVFQNEAVVIITEDVVPMISFVTDNVTVIENGGSAEVCLELSVPLSTDLEVVTISSPGTAGSNDFVPDTKIASFTAGATLACVDFVVTDDPIALEGDETFMVRFDPPNGILPATPTTSTVTIVDDDVPSLSSPDKTVPENIGDADVCVTLLTPIESSFEVSYSTSDGTAQASDPADYNETTGKLLFTPGGSDEVCAMIPIVDDETLEPREDFSVIFTPDVPGTETFTATVRILDNDQIGTIVNDTVLGDPLFTVTLPKGDEFMCYEVHGEAGKYFNLISDTCTSVNALFSALLTENRINTMKEIGVYARDTTNTCVQIEINYDGCIGTIDGRVIQSTYKQNGISIRPYSNRWRVSVPNCGSTQAVMWIFCEPEPDMLRFRIARGNNLSPTSHGLLAQFWNIPIAIVMEDGDVFIDLFDPSDKNYRRIPANREPRTWDQTESPCYYVGNSQGGPLQLSDETVIEGGITDYETASLFSASFAYAKFDELICAT